MTRQSLSKVGKPLKSARVVARAKLARDIEGRKGKLIRIGPREKGPPKSASSKELVEWIRRNRFT